MTKIQVDFENLLESQRHNKVDEAERARHNQVEEVYDLWNTGAKVASAVLGGTKDIASSLASLGKGFKDTMSGIGGVMKLIA